LTVILPIVGLAAMSDLMVCSVASMTMSSRTASWISTICHGSPVRRSLAAPSITPSREVMLCGSFVPHPYPIGSTWLK
jgi:hypothetical protein